MKKCIFLIAAVAAVIPSCAAHAATYEDTYLSKNQQNLCEYFGDMYDISPQLLEALIETESAGLNSVSNGTCYGLCQINGSTWGYEYESESQQINQACQVLLMHLKEQPDMSYALMKYNGSKKALKYYQSGKMTDYAQTVLDRAYEIEQAQGLHNVPTIQRRD